MTDTIAYIDRLQMDVKSAQSRATTAEKQRTEAVQRAEKAEGALRAARAKICVWATVPDHPIDRKRLHDDLAAIDKVLEEQ
jgi:hypothetical protein